MNIFAQECKQCVYVGNPKECHANKPSVLSMLAIHNGSSCIVTATVSPKNYSLHGMFAYNTIYSTTIHPPQWGEIIYEVIFLFSYTYQGLPREVRSAGPQFCLDFVEYIEGGGGVGGCSGGLPVRWLPLWGSCLPEFYRDSPENHLFAMIFISNQQNLCDDNAKSGTRYSQPKSSV